MRSRSLPASGKSIGHELVLDLSTRGGDDRQQLPLAQLHELQVLDHVAVGAGRLHDDGQVASSRSSREVRCMTSGTSPPAGASRSRMSSFSPLVRLRTRSSVST